MKLDFNEIQLLELMKDFYTLTGIRIVLFDDEYQELLAYPAENCEFCSQIKRNETTRHFCTESDQHSFQQCKAAKQLITYHCHAGLIEAAVPLIDNHIVIGYLMFGQISDAASHDDLKETLQKTKLPESLPVLEQLLAKIPLKTDQEIHAAAHIMEACTFYALMNETIALRRYNFTKHLTEYLLPRLGEKIDANLVAKDLGISRSKLYSACDKYLGMGIAEYIRTLRLQQAQTLLKDTETAITEIASAVGFDDYNYFRRVFKKETGCSAKKYREKFKTTQHLSSSERPT